MKTLDEGYGNMSMYMRPPPHVPTQSLTLGAGDALILPAGWWHWVVSEPDTLSVNMWNMPFDDAVPTVRHHDFDGAFVDRSKVELFDWSTGPGSGVDGPRSMHVSLKKYVGDVSGSWTGEDEVRTKRAEILRRIGLDPSASRAGPLNVWYAGDTHSTPLHYDETPNLLLVLRGRKHVRLVHPRHSKDLHPLQIRGGIPPTKQAYFLRDRGKRAYGDAFWEAPSLQEGGGGGIRSPPACLLLAAFMDHHAFPEWTYAYVTALQYAFGVQNLVYACKLDFRRRPYLEFYVFAAESARPHPYALEDRADLNHARRGVDAVDALFGLTHTCVSLRDDAVFLSFEVGRDQAASDVSPSFDAYYESREPRADDALASIDYVNTTTGATKGTFRSMPARDSSLPCEFYWTCEKSDGTSTQFHVGVPWDHARGWLADAFGHRLVESLSDIPYVSNHRFELCDNADASGRRRVALYGIV